MRVRRVLDIRWHLQYARYNISVVTRLLDRTDHDPAMSLADIGMILLGLGVFFCSGCGNQSREELPDRTVWSQGPTDTEAQATQQKILSGSRIDFNQFAEDLRAAGLEVFADAEYVTGDNPTDDLSTDIYCQATVLPDTDDMKITMDWPSNRLIGYEPWPAVAEAVERHAGLSSNQLQIIWYIYKHRGPDIPDVWTMTFSGGHLEYIPDEDRHRVTIIRRGDSE